MRIFGVQQLVEEEQEEEGRKKWTFQLIRKISLLVNIQTQIINNMLLSIVVDSYMFCSKIFKTQPRNAEFKVDN